ncbi:S1 family peptidase (plasmid) [Natrinema thermotolerans]|uniref:S1 family peptidase n=1 Tax=Natrinema thermotolerans TaxID=121872 RepID=A0AAF0T4B5_9EURY|nr:trypsin-like serine protease [Natrinema thermotolerans]QCC57112.1 hypothetical protein DVR14_00070 [Natrinema thermotolerans]WMT10262.1 S1 family peptidase [Natrinema thermotolerans]
MVKDENYHLMGKRRFMKALSGLGLSATAVSLMSQSALAELTDNPENEVPRVKFVRGSPNDPKNAEAEYYTISRDEWEYTQSRYRAGQNLLRSFKNQGIDPTGIDVVVKTQSGRNKDKVVSVQINPEQRKILPQNEKRSVESLRDVIPEKASAELEINQKSVTREVPIIVEEEAGFDTTDEQESTEVTTQSSHWYYDYRYRPIPGGCRIRPQKPDGSWTNCTGGIRSWDLDRGEYVYVTAAHCFDAETGQTMGQRYSYQDVGETDKIAYNDRNWIGSRMDSATVALNDSVDTTARMAADDGGYFSNPVRGYVHTDWLQDNEGGGASLGKLGITTGHTAGNINNVSVSNDYFTTNADRDGGDSGGPHFYIDPDSSNYDFYMAGIHRGSTYSGNARGIIYQNIMEEHNLSLGLSYQ